MRATTIHAARDIRVSEVPDPTIQEATDAIVQVVAGCVCGSDLWNYRGENDINAGATIGHECVGVVTEVGGDVSGFRPGDEVIVPFCHCDNTCPHCQVGAHSVCEHLGFTVSGQAELARVTQADGSLVKVDGGFTEDNLASMLALSDVMPTGWHAAVCADVRPGHTTVVVGDGAVGLCGVLAASAMGAERVIAISRHESRQRIARQFGATEIVAERGREGAARVKDLSDGIGADSVLECVGTKDSMGLAFAVARPGAMVGFVGVPHGAEAPVGRMFSKFVGLRGGMAPVRRYLPDLLAKVQAGEIDPGPVFDSVRPLDEVAAAYADMDERRAVKVMIRP